MQTSNLDIQKSPSGNDTTGQITFRDLTFDQWLAALEI